MNSCESWPQWASEGNGGSRAATLIAEMRTDPTGSFAPSCYETGRVVTLAPSAPGHPERVRFLLAGQRADGTWGGPDGYALVPTLSATEAMLTTLRLGTGDGIGSTRVARAAGAGLRALTRLLSGRPALPDTVAVELIVPALVGDLNAQLATLDRAPLPGLDSWRGHRLPVPGGANEDLLARLRAAVRHGEPVPHKLWHSLEVVGEAARGAPSVEPVAGGGVGCSPAATAAWLDERALRTPGHPGLRYLRTAQAADGGMPVAAPLALFERSWVLSTLADAGIRFPVPADLVASMHAEFGEHGAAGGHGLPPDVDDTATALYALTLLHSPRSAECLWEYDTGDHFRCFPAERTPSTSANAHVLQAVGALLGTRAALPGRGRYEAAARRVTAWLREHQHPDGSWTDKWHASPYYATACCATALAAYGGAAGAGAVHAAVDWVLGTQRADGSWGHWEGTSEETAYAIRTLLRTGAARPGGAVERAAALGGAYLLAQGDRTDFPALWHDKDLYTPVRIVRTEVLAALHLVSARPGVAALTAAHAAGASLRRPDRIGAR
ncbi:prenyltransferase/squalene oxidase-like repeat protein [Prauserella shujinwangii]|uniref:Prenyltransferase/squalene oxidase-like repeat protein n=1 Tax=Prauserella shujinwangii TaxID=1453103 RepID=A0A2T0LL91_9PSEU|nr:prenyltransferase/squalene oxidase repeat-containing protein [Prauserella shujinwangii]PRX43718.1 prenyltransferase/squalene oxidase-like repeat protein [Prauserella shujinwangii]